MLAEPSDMELYENHLKSVDVRTLEEAIAQVVSAVGAEVKLTLSEHYE